MESPNTKTIIQRKTTTASDVSPCYTKHSQKTCHSKQHINNNLCQSSNECNENIQAEKHFLSQMKDIIALYKNQLMEVKESITKNQITDIPRYQSSVNKEQPVSNQINLNLHMSQHNNHHYQLNCHQQFPASSSKNNQSSFQPQHTQLQQQYNPHHSPLITIPSNQNIHPALY